MAAPTESRAGDDTIQGPRSTFRPETCGPRVRAVPQPPVRRRQTDSIDDEARMIERYTLPEMKAIWELQNKYDTWLKVELAIVEAQAEIGRIPRDVADRILARATFTLDRA